MGGCGVYAGADRRIQDIVLWGDVRGGGRWW
jgi:hypothetical protein